MSDPSSFADRVQFDQLNVDTPEQVALRFPVAGIGSRFLAASVDSLLIFLAYLVLSLLAYITSAGKSGIAALDRHSSVAQNWWAAAFILANFLLIWGYFGLFEAFWQGQTPGKRFIKIRVIKDSGRAITLFEALARNLLRVVDFFPGFYLVGVIAMLSNRSQKRLGDLVAGTIVVHERVDEQPLLTHHSRSLTASLYPSEPPADSFSWNRRLAPSAGETQALSADLVARLSPADLHLIETFFSRALDLSVQKRAELAARVAGTLCARLGTPMPPDVAPERLLEQVAHQMRAQTRF